MKLRTQLIDTEYGKLNVFPEDHIGKSVMTNGYYEAERIRIILNNCTKTGMAVDVGANIGTHTVAFSTHFDEVYSFEPQNEVFDLLEKNRELNDVSGKAYQWALGHTGGRTYMKEEFSDGKTNYGNRSIAIAGEKKTMARLDDLKLKPDLIKVDIEGAEQLFFYGAQETIKEHRPVIFYEYDKIPEFMNTYHAYNREVREFNIFKFLMVDLKYYRIERIANNYIALP